MQQDIKNNILELTPESPLRKPGLFFKRMWQDLLASRQLAWRLLVRNISAQYRQTFLGYIWAFLPPVFTTLVFVFLNSTNLIKVDSTGVPYTIYVMTGTVLWFVFYDGISVQLKIVSNSRYMLTKIYFPREALILSALGEVFINFLIRFILLLVVLIAYKTSFTWSFLLVPLGVFSLMMLGLMFGILLTPLSLLYRDIEKGLPLVLQIWFFITPVIYLLPKTGSGSLLNYINPVAPVLNTTRELMIQGRVTQSSLFLIITISTLFLIIIGWVLYRIAMPHLIARIGS